MSAKTYFLACLCCLGALLAPAQGQAAASTNTPTPMPSIAGLNPAPKILVIVGNCSSPNESYGNTIVTRMKTVLAGMIPPPTFDFINVPCTAVGTANGINGSLAGRQLTDYCQVWDMRVVGGGTALGSVDWTTFTLTGPTSDKALYEAFLKSGGSLYLLGDNNTLHDRNDNLINLLNAWSTGGTIPYPNQIGGGDFWFSTFPPMPIAFQGTPYTLNYRYTKWPGYVLLGQTGSGRPITQQDSGTGDGTGSPTGTIIVSQFAFLPQDTTLGAGRVIVDLDWTSWGAEWNNTAADSDQMAKWVRNAYNWMGNCYYRYTVTKAASVVPPSTVCLGQNFNYLLCVNNIGSNPLAAGTILDDTFPGCLIYQSAVPAYNSKTGQYVAWLAGAVPAGTSYCVTVTVKATSLPPCP